MNDRATDNTALTEVDEEFVRERVHPSFLATRVEFLEQLAQRKGQTWQELATKYGAKQDLPPWKVNVDGLCDALDDSACTSSDARVATFAERRNEEDLLIQERYSDLPYPENQLVALAHSLVARGIIDEEALQDRLEQVKQRLTRED